jgi:hypothetical protein
MHDDLFTAISVFGFALMVTGCGASGSTTGTTPADQGGSGDFPGYMNSDWYLTNIFTGFEIWKGGINLESTSFCAEVN